MNLLAGLCTPDSGRILIAGASLTALDAEAWRRRISAAFQDHARFEFTLQRAVGLGRLAELDDPAAATAALNLAGPATCPMPCPQDCKPSWGQAGLRAWTYPAASGRNSPWAGQ